MTSPKQILFKIDHLDPFGQGVFKQDDQIYFISKVLPGEEGTALVKKSRKGVHFAALQTLTKKSSRRTLAQCKHYQKCQGCSYLHMDYSVELDFKAKALLKHLSKLETPELKLHPNSKRFNYRNRIQLHYNKKQNVLGYVNSMDKKIVDIDECPLAEEAVFNSHKELYKNWQSKAPKGRNHGHVEISNQIHWDEDYAKGGFTQVNEEINSVLKKLVAELGNGLKPKKVLDLFSGRGNLSDQVQCEKRIMVDYSPQKIPDYYALDLFDTTASDQLKKKVNDKNFDLIIIDPPRKGFPDMRNWLQTFPTKNVIYVSCNPTTLARDLINNPEYQITSLHLLDMFPGTGHFETLVTLEIKN